MGLKERGGGGVGKTKLDISEQTYTYVKRGLVISGKFVS